MNVAGCRSQRVATFKWDTMERALERRDQHSYRFEITEIPKSNAKTLRKGQAQCRSCKTSMGLGGPSTDCRAGRPFSGDRRARGRKLEAESGRGDDMHRPDLAPHRRSLAATHWHYKPCVAACVEQRRPRMSFRDLSGAGLNKLPRGNCTRTRAPGEIQKTLPTLH